MEENKENKENKEGKDIKKNLFLRGINDVSDERLRQIEEKGFNEEHDKRRAGGELAAAGACYAMHSAWSLYPDNEGETLKGVPVWWPLDPEDWKPGDIRENLVKAAALILAEIDKIDSKQNT